MAGISQIVTSEIASDWVMKAMVLADLDAANLSRKSGVPLMTIHNIIHNRNKNGCRTDILVVLVRACGFTFRDFEDVAVRTKGR